MSGPVNVQVRTEDFSVRIPPPKMITVQEELALVRNALARDPGSPELRYRLAHLLSTMDKFDEAIDLLRGLSVERSEFRVLHLLGTNLLARENAQDTIAARQFAMLAVDAAESRRDKARALASLGKAHVRMAELKEGRDRLCEALDENVANKDAYKRLAMLDFQTGRVREASDFAEAMLARGVGHSRVLGVRPLAFARLGQVDEAHEAVGLDPFLHRTFLRPPPGWPTIEAFNKELAAELLAHPGIRYERYGVASAHTWRVDEPALARSRLVPVLHKLIREEAIAYVARLAGKDHPWLRARPSKTFLHSWCVMTDGDGFEEWHVHQNGWISGAYYVEVPDYIVNGDGPAGCISFGLPAGIVGEDRCAEYGETIIRPESGLLLLFPAHAFHRTFPHNGDRRRICIAFDIAADF